MKAIPRFEREPYRRELEVEILEVAEARGKAYALLDDTILYPEGGGQPSDRGRLGDAEILRVERQGTELRHFLSRPVSPGGSRLVLDWQRRYDHMQQHSAQHLLTSLALARFGWSTRSFHIGAEASDIELDVPPLDREQLDALESAVAAEVAAARSIRAYRVTPDELEALDYRSRRLPKGHLGTVRLVEIEGIDLNTCGGTHVASTAEIGLVHIVRVEPLRGGCRLSWVAGERSRRRLKELEQRAAELRQLLDSADSEVISVVSLKLQQLDEARRDSRRFGELLISELSDRLLAGQAQLIELHLEWGGSELVQRLARRLAAAEGPRIGLITTEAGARPFFAAFASAESGIEAATLGRLVEPLLGGRGGGARGVYQGKAESLTGRAEALSRLRELLEERQSD